jgi:TRAP transporter TAXI family solute receptor
MHKLDPSRFGIPALALLSAVLLISLVAWFKSRSQEYRLVVAAGSAKGESYILAEALKHVAEQHHPRLRIQVRETGGTSENLRLLESGEAQLATAQADVPAVASARSVAVLFGDAFQLVVHPGATSSGIPGLKGKRIALPRRGGQYQSFLHVAEHFGLAAGDFQFVGDTDAEADAAFQAGAADAAFRVRALGNPSITKLVRSGQVIVVAIPQAAAMRIKIPAFQPAEIPQGAYLGEPPIPAFDLPTVAVQRTLLAHRRVPEEAIGWIAGVLLERREELAQAIPDRLAEVRPLLAQLRKPDPDAGLGAPVHPGAQAFFDKDKPSFVQEHADFLALIVSLVVLAGTWLWELKRWVERKQKNQADHFTNRAIALMNQARTGESGREQTRQQLLDLLTEAVHALDVDKISEESFQSFRSVLQIALEVTRDLEPA